MNKKLGNFLFVAIFFIGVTCSINALATECESFFSNSPSDEIDHLSIIKNLEQALMSENRIPTISEISGSGAEGKKARAYFSSLPFQNNNAKLAAYLEDIINQQRSTKLVRFRLKIAREYLKLLNLKIYPPTHAELAQQTGINAAVIKLVLGEEPKQIERVFSLLPLQMVQLRNRLAQVYATKCRETGKILSFEEWMETLKINERDSEWIISAKEDHAGVFANFEELRGLAQENHSSSFNATIHSELTSPALQEKWLQAIRTKKRLVVSTAVAGAKVDELFLASLEAYCRARDAHLVVIPANMTTYELDPILLNKDWIHILTHETELLPSLRIANLKINPGSMNPLLAVEKLGKRGQSVIVGAPKIFEKVIATVGNNKNPHRMLSTGAITAEDYGGDRYIPRRGEQIAGKHHRLGAVVVERSDEIESEGFFHLRHIEFLDGAEGFTDVGLFYGADGEIDEARYAGVTPGDLHIGQENETAVEEAKKMIRELKPKKVILHDVLNAESINPHITHRPLSQAQRNIDEAHNLVNELDKIARKINEILGLDPHLEVWIVRSNHDLWLDRWLASGEFMQDPENQAMGLALAQYLLHDRDANAFEIALKVLPWSRSLAADLVPTKITDTKRVKFLNVGQTLEIGPKENPVQVGMHGHKGVRGANGVSLRDMQTIAGRSIIGHTHTIGRVNDAVNTGTLTELDMGYNRDGASDWVQAVSLISEYGEIQTLVLKNGRFHATKNRVNRSASANFFPKGFPKLNPNHD